MNEEGPEGGGHLQGFLPPLPLLPAPLTAVLLFPV